MVMIGKYFQTIYGQEVLLLLSKYSRYVDYDVNLIKTVYDRVSEITELRFESGIERPEGGRDDL